MRNTLILACLISLTPSCTLNRQTVLTTPVGPPPSAIPSRSPKGALAVYSALDFGGPGDAEYASRHHSGYWLLSADGTRLKYIYNRISTFVEDPETVPVAPGTYKIRATAAPSGQ